MKDDVLLLDIGPSAGALPAETAVPEIYASWFPVPHQAEPVPPVEGVVPTPVADGVLIEWDAVDQDGVIYIIERGPTSSGPWEEIARVADTRYLYSDGSGEEWYFRITAAVRGRPAVGTITSETPKAVPTDQELIDLQNALDAEAVIRFNSDAAEASARTNAIAAEVLARASGDAQLAADLLAEAVVRGTAINQEKSERISGDSAEAAARETLAAQMRGLYTGTDITAVATGLMHSERQARVAGDGANASSLAAEVTARETLQAAVENPATGLAATRARVIEEEQVRADEVSAVANRTALLETGLEREMNLVRMPVFRAGTNVGTWATVFQAAGIAAIGAVTGWDHPHELRVLSIRYTGETARPVVAEAGNLIPVVPGDVLVISADMRATAMSGATYTLAVWYRDASGTQIGSTAIHNIGNIVSAAAWLPRRGKLTVPAGAVTAQLCIVANSPPAEGRVFATNIHMEREGADSALHAQAIQHLETRTSIAEGALESHSTSIAGLSVTAGTQQASITNLMEASAATAITLPIIRNAGFEEGTGTSIPGWSRTRGAPNTLPDGAFSVAGLGHTGDRCIRFGHTAANGPGGQTGLSAHVIMYTDNTIPVRVGDKLRMSFWSRVTQGPSAGATLRPYLHFMDANGDRIDYTVSGAMVIPIANHNWTRRVTPVVVVPAGTVGVVLDFRTAGTLPITPFYGYIDDVRLEVLSESEDEARARHTIALDVNGYVSGTFNENDGTTSSFAIKADSFTVVPSSPTGERIHWSDGSLRIYDSADTLRVRIGVW